MKKIILPIVFCAFIIILSFLTIILPKKERSDNERRLLEKAPEFSVNNLIKGKYTSDIDSYLSDHFAFRDLWIGINSYYNYSIGLNGKNGVYKSSEGYLISESEKIDFEKASRNFELIKSFEDNSGLKTLVMIIPSKGYVLENHLQHFHKQYEDDKVYDLAKSCGLNVIDTREVLKSEIKEVYYKTDHHLNTYGSYLIYKLYSEKVNNGFTEFVKFDEINNFYGTTYSKGGFWISKPDTIELYKRRDNQNSGFKVIIEDKEYKSLFFKDKAESNDKYEYFLDGNHGFVDIINENNKNGKKLLIIKDSFAHCFTTFIAEDYEEIVMIDLRYYKKSIKNIISDYKLNECLILYGAENIANSTDISWIIF